MKEFVKKYWIIIALVVVVIAGVTIYMRRRKKKASESNFIKEMPCADCGPGGMFGPGWTMEKFEKHLDNLKKRARELSGGISSGEFELAIQRSGGFIPYIQGREIALKRMEEATSNLRDVMNIKGVHGLGSIMDDHIEIAVIDENTKEKVLKFIEEKKKEMPMIPGHGKGYMNYPVKIVTREMTVAQ